MPASWINPLVPLAWELLQHLQVGSVGSELCPQSRAGVAGSGIPLEKSVEQAEEKGES